jgi:hypothetical protein
MLSRTFFALKFYGKHFIFGSLFIKLSGWKFSTTKTYFLLKIDGNIDPNNFKKG